MSSDKFRSHSVCQFPCLSNENSNSTSLRVVVKMKEQSEKAGLKLNIKKTKTIASSPITSWQIEGEKMEGVIDSLRVP